ncbi:hypothetical protein N7468_005517 [Penicillium chermesinum]|uniref:Uncharacterized protein n=1 Tax=Penicillium chermesinum TaxID=63820 RepID=A0A9W9NZD5_9EURO|nr:uncharacterized protein N7468_005517 [Penicillium chermesinum]KAJ5232561.1 hypothetical protein N7468_005517 [Penicillium chermesinum]KAJ6172217.1 hypothetical protein N7470_001284 [Penicillium chermesinum]
MKRQVLQTRQIPSVLGTLKVPPTPRCKASGIQSTFIEDWMFLNTTPADFVLPLEPLGLSGPDLPRIEQAVEDPDPFVDIMSLLDSDCPGNLQEHFENTTEQCYNRDEDSMLGGRWINQSPTESYIPYELSPFGLNGKQLILLDYFTHKLIPRCTTWPVENPFVSIILPICLSATEKPLFYTVMAISSHQLSMLEDKRFERDIWEYRAKALRGFQREIGRFRSGDEPAATAGWEHITATLVMLTFFDASLCRFFSSYFAAHEAFARTAYNLVDPYMSCVSWFSPETVPEMTIIDAFLGCSPELILLISEISDLATGGSPLGCSPHDRLGEAESLQERRRSISAKRHSIERRLHTLKQLLPFSATIGISCVEGEQTEIEELLHIAETRRLSALVYLYSRLDDAAPGSSPISKLWRFQQETGIGKIGEPTANQETSECWEGKADYRGSMENA